MPGIRFFVARHSRTMGTVIKKKEAIAERLGETFAVMQHGMDLVAEWGLKKMRDVQNASATSSKDSTTIGKLMGFGRNAVSFLGAVGDSYYQTYEEAKGKRKNKKNVQ